MPQDSSTTPVDQIMPRAPVSTIQAGREEFNDETCVRGWGKGGKVGAGTGESTTVLSTVKYEYREGVAKREWRRRRVDTESVGSSSILICNASVNENVDVDVDVNVEAIVDVYAIYCTVHTALHCNAMYCTVLCCIIIVLS